MDADTAYRILGGMAPAIIAMLVVDYMDRKRPEPLALRYKVALAGALSVFPVLLVDGFIEGALRDYTEPMYTYNGALYKSFVIAAAVEELLKISVIYWLVWRRPEFDERMDGIVYGARAGLGFALVENVFYLLEQPSSEAALYTGILRAVLAVPGHAMWSAFIGYAAARARFDGKGWGFLGGYVLAVAAHGGYDYAIFAQAPLRLEGYDSIASAMFAAPVVIILVCVLIVRRMARTALALDDADHARRGQLPPPPAPLGPERV